MRKVHYINNQSDLSLFILNTDQNDSLYICNSLKNKAELERVFQIHRGLENSCFWSEDEFKKNIYTSQFTCLEDIKRYICLYYSIPEDLKRKYKLRDYFSSVTYLNNILEFFTELSESMITPQEIIPLLNKDLHLKTWQENYLTDLICIYESYHAYLSSRGFSDKIFNNYQHEISLLNLSSFNQVVFINKLHFCNLDKFLIDLLINAGIKVKIIIQGTADCFDQDNLCLKSQSLNNIDPQKIKIYEAKNKFGMHRLLLNLLAQEKITEIIDHEIKNENFYNILNKKYFSIKDQKEFNNTRIYRFFNQLNELLSDMIFEEKKQKFLLPLFTIFHTMMNTEFLNFLGMEANTENHFKLKALFQDLNQNSFFYLDCEGEFINQFKNLFDKYELYYLFDKFFIFMRKFTELSTLDVMLNYLSDFSNNHLLPFFKEGLHNTNELDVFLEALVNIQSIIDLSLIDDFNLIFPDKRKSSAYLLSFILEFLRAKKINVTSISDNESKKIKLYDFKNALDSDSKEFALLNMQEGILPSVRKIPFVLNDEQRKILHLKTFDQQKIEEKYTFAYLLNNAQTAHIFYIENQDENTQRSSFLEEILLNKHIEPLRLEDIAYDNYYNAILKPSSINIPNQTLKSSLDFFTLPFNPNQDLPEMLMKLSYYSWSKMKNDAFCWLIDYQYAFSNFNEVNRPYLSFLNLGNLTHKIIEKLIKSSDFLKLQNPEYFNTKLNYYFDLIQTSASEYYYKMPYNFDGKFFNYFLKDFIKNRIFEFFYSCSLNLKSDNPAWYSEMKLQMRKALNLNTYSLQIELNSRVDLLIKDENDFLLYDFKTGSATKDQLDFYRMIWLFNNHENDWDSFFAKTYNLVSEKHSNLSKILNDENSLNYAIQLYNKIITRITEIIELNCQASNKMLKSDFYAPIVRLKELKHLLSEKGMI